MTKYFDILMVEGARLGPNKHLLNQSLAPASRITSYSDSPYSYTIANAKESPTRLF